MGYAHPWDRVGIKSKVFGLKITLSRICCPLCPIHTADATQLSSCVASTSAVWTQFTTSSRRLPTDSVDNLESDQTDSIAFDYTNFELIDIDNFFNSDVIMSSFLEKLSTSMKIHVLKPLWSLFGQFPNCRPNPSAVVVSQLWIVFTPPMRLNSTLSTVASRRRCVLSIKVESAVW